MKKIILLLIALNISCIAKSQTLDIYNSSDYAQIPNAYFKDITNFQNKFVGTWVFQSGNQRLEMKFRKIENMLNNPGPQQHYEDILVGEYKYIDQNGVLKVNSLPNLNINHPRFYDYNLYSMAKMEAFAYPATCRECPAGPSLERMLMHFDEAGNDDAGIEAFFVMSYSIENGVEKLYTKLIHEYSATNENKADLNSPSVFRAFSVPYGFYTLIKE